MKKIVLKTERIHSLDSLRAVMMLLGIILHSAITFGTVDYGASWDLKDPNATSLLNDLVVIFIHSFRMPIFFLVAGFFGAMLFYERSPLKMIKNRLSRIAYPFIVFFVLLTPFIIFTVSYSIYVFAGFENPLEATWKYFARPISFASLKTYHLWFLYYLILITCLTVLVALLMKKVPSVSQKVSSLFNKVFSHLILRILVLSGITFLIYLFMGVDQVATSFSFLPDINTLAFYSFFYSVGWLLFKSKHLLPGIPRLDWLNVSLASVLLLTYVFTIELLNFELKIMISSVVVWLFVFGITGLFIRYGSKYSVRMRYISDSSYWVYLVHFIFVLILPGLIANWALPAIVKFVTVASTTAVICFLTYHYFVRSTWIGKFLNGRKYSRRISDLEELEGRKKEKQTDTSVGRYKKPSPV